MIFNVHVYERLNKQHTKLDNLPTFSRIMWLICESDDAIVVRKNELLAHSFAAGASICFSLELLDTLYRQICLTEQCIALQI